MSAALITQTLDWTQVLVVGIPLLVGQIATVIVAVLNNRKASAAAAKVDESSARVHETAEKVDEIHGTTKMSNGKTLAHAVEGTSREVGELRREVAMLTTALGDHLGDHQDRRKR